MNMYRQSVESSNIKSIGYDPALRTLQIEFKNGGIYEYAEVMPNEYDNLMDAASIGSFFHYNIKDRYETTKLN